MKGKKISISNNGLKYLNHDVDSKFIFKVGDSSYSCSRIAADFISPAVSRLHATEPFASVFIINIRDSRHLFKKVICLMNGDSISINSKEAKTLLQISHCLQNTELAQLIFDNFNMKEITLANAVSILNFKQEYEISFLDEVEFIASNIAEISLDELKGVDLNVLYQILSNDKLKIENEDYLMDFIMNLSIENKNYTELLECVQFQYVSQLKMSEFLANFKLDDLSPTLWQQLCHRLVECPSLPFPKVNRFINRAKFALNECDPLNGILQSFNRNCGGNAHAKKVIHISASSNKYNTCWQVISKNWNDKWYSHNEKNSWWMVDFKEKKVAVDCYTIQTDECGPDSDHLKSWKIEGSNNNIDWYLIDEQKDTYYLNGNYYRHSFVCNSTNPYRYLRLMQTAENHNHFNFLVLKGIEFFGTVYSE